jgi:hypothetical protein
MLKNSVLNQLCLYTEFYQYMDYTIPEKLLFISLGIQCFYSFDDRYLGDDGVKKLRSAWCRLLDVDGSPMVVVHGLTSRCVENPVCLGFHVQAFAEEIAGAPRTSICDIIESD